MRRLLPLLLLLALARVAVAGDDEDFWTKPIAAPSPSPTVEPAPEDGGVPDPEETPAAPAGIDIGVSVEAIGVLSKPKTGPAWKPAPSPSPSMPAPTISPTPKPVASLPPGQDDASFWRSHSLPPKNPDLTTPTPTPTPVPTPTKHPDLEIDAPTPRPMPDPRPTRAPTGNPDEDFWNQSKLPPKDTGDDLSTPTPTPAATATATPVRDLDDDDVLEPTPRPSPTPTPNPTPNRHFDDDDVTPTPTPRATATPSKKTGDDASFWEIRATPTPAATPTPEPDASPQSVEPQASPTPEAAETLPPLRDPNWSWRGSRSSGGTWADGFADGRKEALGAPVGDWMAIGAAGSCTLGPAGCLGATAAGQFVDFPSHQIRELDPSRAPDYQSGYQQGYERELKNRRSKAALQGGGIAGAVFVGLYIALLATAAA